MANDATDDVPDDVVAEFAQALDEEVTAYKADLIEAFREREHVNGKGEPLDDEDESEPAE